MALKTILKNECAETSQVSLCDLINFIPRRCLLIFVADVAIILEFCFQCCKEKLQLLKDHISAIIFCSLGLDVEKVF